MAPRRDAAARLARRTRRAGRKDGGPLRCPRPGGGAPGAGDRGRGRTPRAVDRPARLREKHARAPSAGSAAPARVQRGARGDEAPFGERPPSARARPHARATVPLPAPLGDAFRASWAVATRHARRDLARAPRRAVPGRTLALPAQHPRWTARSARDGRGDDRPLRHARALPGEAAHRCGDEPLRMRLARTPQAWLRLRASGTRALRGEDLRAHPRSTRPADRGDGAHVRGADDGERWRGVGARSQPGAHGARGAAQARLAECPAPRASATRALPARRRGTPARGRRHRPRWA
jgi:hypothetical protein